MVVRGGKLSDIDFQEMKNKVSTYFNSILDKQGLKGKDFLLNFHTDKINTILSSDISLYKSKDDKNVEPIDEIDSLLKCITQIIEKNKETFTNNAKRNGTSWLQYQLTQQDIMNIKKDISKCILDLESNRTPVKKQAYQDNKGQQNYRQQNYGQYNYEKQNYGQYNYRQQNYGQYNYEKQNYGQQNYRQQNYGQYNYGQQNKGQKNKRQQNYEEYEYGQKSYADPYEEYEKKEEKKNV